LYYPAEASPLGEIPHDGIGEANPTPSLLRRAGETLVVAGCDPAAGILARLYEKQSGFRMLVFQRSSQQALDLLQQGLVHVAGVHLGASDAPDTNMGSVKKSIAQPSRLLRVTSWEEGIAVGSSFATSSVQGLLKSSAKWIGREAGSGARKCLDELFEDRQPPRRVAKDHRSVATAIQCGWADAGVCVKIASQEAGLKFLPIKTEGYDFCFYQADEDDPRIAALIRVIQSNEFRQTVKELPGYDTRHAGSMSSVG
jgi:molybdate-binding protein